MRCPPWPRHRPPRRCLRARLAPPQRPHPPRLSRPDQPHAAPLEFRLRVGRPRRDLPPRAAFLPPRKPPPRSHHRRGTARRSLQHLLHLRLPARGSRARGPPTPAAFQYRHRLHQHQLPLVAGRLQGLVPAESGIGRGARPGRHRDRASPCRRVPRQPVFPRPRRRILAARPRRRRHAACALHHQLRHPPRARNRHEIAGRTRLVRHLRGRPRRAAPRAPGKTRRHPDPSGHDPRLDRPDPPPASDAPRRREQSRRRHHPGSHRRALSDDRQPSRPRPGRGQLRTPPPPPRRGPGRDPGCHRSGTPPCVRRPRPRLERVAQHAHPSGPARRGPRDRGAPARALGSRRRTGTRSLAARPGLPRAPPPRPPPPHTRPATTA